MRKDSKTLKAMGELYMLRVKVLALVAQQREIRHPSRELLETCAMLQTVMEYVTKTFREGNLLQVSCVVWEQSALPGFAVDLDGLIILPPEEGE